MGMGMHRYIGTLGLFALTTACARLPPVDYNYYPSKGMTTVSVTQTFDCSADKKRLVVVTAPPAVATSYSADYSKQVQLLAMSGIRGEFTDNDFTINFYEDGRLKSINSVSTGKGEAILKTAISIVGAALPLIGAGDGTKDMTSECTALAIWGKDKPVSVTFTGSIDLAADTGGVINLIVAPDSSKLFADLNRAPPQIRLTSEGGPIVPAVRAKTDTANYVDLSLQKVYPSKLEVSQDGAAFWVGRVLVPKPEYYNLPVPKAALFGKTTVVVNVAESGAVTSIQYGKETGAGAALNLVSAGLSEISPDSDATKVGAVKAQADLIAQSQRLARCQAQPDKCE
jgi:hypothetical protein